MQGLIGFPISPWNVFTRINEDFYFAVVYLSGP